MTIPFADIAIDADVATQEEAHEIRMRRLAFALAYPFSHPDRSYIYLGDYGAAPLPDRTEEWLKAKGAPARMRRAIEALSAFDFSSATAVLAAGSNAAPLQLTRKYMIHEDHLSSIVIPCLRVRVSDHIACYTRQMAPYGSIPTMIVRHEGAASLFYVNILDPHMLDRLNHTEGLGTHYGLTELGHIEASGFAPIEGMPVYGYQGLSGPFPYRLDTTPAFDCDMPAIGQRGIQERIIDGLGLDVSVERFVLRNIYEPDHRAEIVERLRDLEI
ncbi:hypothetical protein [Notoacmeibacter sp. MSK16QG-6]|uniref:hypothetical protein n=1 Tax=Notoacmeibacter sp. MSK16QG-6 TaxID=2957982 RepID=UPI00209CBAF6|nr:hypothetical protein [Notoacmeibacter sp. MSK16QG-6]MCP1200154.1 hypothetical protein [Notoacmeibacter sp. MSK16QG-6]